MTPENVEKRTKRVLIKRQYRNIGPMFLIHIDGYDKLKRYGLPIHADIHGYIS